MNWYRRVTDAGHPCLTAEVVRDLAARQGLEAIPIDTQTFSGPFSRRERLFYHLLLFLIGSCDLVFIDVGRTPHHLWFWPWVTGWAALLVIHAGVVLLTERRKLRVQSKVGADCALRPGASL
jgi:hypothetical protein